MVYWEPHVVASIVQFRVPWWLFQDAWGWPGNLDDPRIVPVARPGTWRDLIMPYVSEAQRGYFHAHKKELEAQGVNVGEWDRASKGKKLPRHKGKKTKHACALHRIACWVLSTDPGQESPDDRSQTPAPGGWFRKLAELAAASGLVGGDPQQSAGNGVTQESCVTSVLPAVPAVPADLIGSVGRSDHSDRPYM
jgi:hypothetical protein